MKIILALLISTLCNAQITLIDMKTIIKMDYDSFETFAMKKGFSFSNIQSDEQKKPYESVTYTKGLGKNTKYITLYSKFIDFNKRSVIYQTNNETEYLLIKNQMKEQGFVLFDTEHFQERGVLFKTYKNKNYTLILGTGKNEINTVTYEISLEIIEK